MDENKKKALDAALAAIQKQHGKGSVMILGANNVEKIPAIPSGCLSLDKAIGIGGYPKGRIIEIVGAEAAGKSTLALQATASCQKQGGAVAYVDAEHALDPSYAQRLGVDLDSLVISQPDSGEQALDIVETLVRSGAIDLVVVDSVAALVPLAELEGEMGDNFVGLQARMLSKAMRKLAGTISKTNSTVIFINQFREKVGVIYGNPETTPGGRALKYFASLRIELRRVEDIKNGKDKVGVRTRAKCIKNKVAPPFKEAVFDIYFGKGISLSADIAELAIATGVVSKSGAWLYLGEQRWQGKDSFRKDIETNEELRTQLIDLINKSELPEVVKSDSDTSDEGEDLFEEE